MALSANDEESLQLYLQSLKKHLINPAVSIKVRDLAYTMSVRRSHHFYRAYLLMRNTLIDQTKLTYGKKMVDKAKIGYVFTGQGAQWSQMGQDIIRNFPIARAILQRLDDALQALPSPPAWSLIGECWRYSSCEDTDPVGELSQPRKPEHIRRPEFSQPLVTALQILQVTVLESWGIRAESVVGHSSGEIAAAYTAGYLTAEDAIRIAYYRGQVVSGVGIDLVHKLGMLAVGLAYDACLPYIQGKETGVQVGCFNSPSSITLSGRLDHLKEVRARLQEDGHFARLLQVDMAYHSSFVADIGSSYKDLLDEHCKISGSSQGKITLFSSLTGTQMNGSCNSLYWRNNMVSPVNFEGAARAMILAPGGIDYLFEIGPSDSLSGPIAQIKKSMTETGIEFTYSSAAKRGPSAIDALFDIAGRLHLAGHKVLMAEVNRDHGYPKEPNVIVDLPNYSWNHSTKYWHEGQASKDWRFGRFRHHDLLGSKILGTSWRFPSWRNLLNVESLPWLRDHKVREMQACMSYCSTDYDG